MNELRETNTEKDSWRNKRGLVCCGDGCVGKRQDGTHRQGH